MYTHAYIRRLVVGAATTPLHANFSIEMLMDPLEFLKKELRSKVIIM